MVRVSIGWTGLINVDKARECLWNVDGGSMQRLSPSSSSLFVLECSSFELSSDSLWTVRCSDFLHRHTWALNLLFSALFLHFHLLTVLHLKHLSFSLYDSTTSLLSLWYYHKLSLSRRRVYHNRVGYRPTFKTTTQTPTVYECCSFGFRSPFRWAMLLAESLNGKSVWVRRWSDTQQLCTALISNTNVNANVNLIF